MTRISRSKLLSLIVAFGTLALAGCGGSAPPPVPTGEQIVFVTTQDCNSFEKLTKEECTFAVKKALEDHLATAPTYKSLTSCTKAEGINKCERADDTTFRPRLLAISVIIFDAEAARKKQLPIPVTPLYATATGEPGFRTPAKTVLKGDDELIKFTPKAVAAYSQFPKVGGSLF